MMMTKRIGWTLLMAASFVILNSCSAIEALLETSKPTVSLEQVRVTGLSFQDVDLNFRVKIDNPNALGVSMAGFGYGVDIEGNSFVQGEQEQPLNIAAGGESFVDVPVKLSFKDLYDTYRSLQDADSTSYAFRMNLKFDLNELGQQSIPFETEGYLPLVKRPRIDVGKIRVRKINLTGADLELRLNVENPNGFGLALNTLNYDFQISGRSLGKGSATEMVSVPEKGEGRIDLPFRVNFLEVGRSVFDIINGKSDLDYRLVGNADIGTTLPMFKSATLPFDTKGKAEIEK